jgi:hypothetical protein
MTTDTVSEVDWMTRIYRFIIRSSLFLHIDESNSETGS